MLTPSIESSLNAFSLACLAVPFRSFQKHSKNAQIDHPDRVQGHFRPM